MSNVGKTRLAGHGLQYEGRRRYNADGRYDWHGDYVKCECGLLSEPGITSTAARRWHDVHKDEIRAAQ